MPPMKELDKQLIRATIAGTTLAKININRELEPFYRAAAGLAETGKGGTVNKFYDAFKQTDSGQTDSILLRRTLLEVGYRMEFMKEELKQLRGDFDSLNKELEACLRSCSDSLPED